MAPLSLLLLSIISLLHFGRGTPIRSALRRFSIRDALNLTTAQDSALFFSDLGASALGNGTLSPRLELRELQSDPDQWQALLLGTSRFQAVNQTDKLSYYQIAGIHGMPFIAWDGVQGVAGAAAGYCAHTSNIFPTWHRPYLALYEELLLLYALEAISEFPDGALKDRLTAALSTLRLPYWDWAAVPPTGEGTMPMSLQNQTVDIVTHNGTMKTVANPLFAYHFHNVSRKDFEYELPFSMWPSTLRGPTSLYDPGATSQNDIIASQIDQNRPNAQSRVFYILGMESQYATISNDASQGDSLEAIHDTMHNLIGGGGHMGDIAVSSFDPAFWFHHAYIDRLFAIWQRLYPDSYVNAAQQVNPTFTTQAGDWIDVNSPLTPFHMDDSGTPWTSASAIDITQFAYTYSILEDMDNSNNSELTRRVTMMYGPNAAPQNKRDVTSRATAGAPSFTAGKQYVANIKVQKFGLDQSFNTYIFIGDAPCNDSTQWTKEPSFVGISGIFSSTKPHSNVTGVQAIGTVPLTAAMEAKERTGEIQSLDEECVSQYLREYLHWRILKIDGTQIAPENTPGFELSVIWSDVEPAKSTYEFPKLMGDYHVLLNATDGKQGEF